MFDATFTGAAAAVGLARPSRPMPGPTSRSAFDIARLVATGAARAGAALSALVGAAGFGAAGFAIGLGGGGLGSSFFFFSSRVTAKVIVFLPRPFRSATVTRLSATPRCSPTETMTVAHRTGLLRLLDVDGELGDAVELCEVEDVNDLAVHHFLVRAHHQAQLGIRRDRCLHLVGDRRLEDRLLVPAVSPALQQLDLRWLLRRSVGGLCARQLHL